MQVLAVKDLDLLNTEKKRCGGQLFKQYNKVQTLGVLAFNWNLMLSWKRHVTHGDSRVFREEGRTTSGVRGGREKNNLKLPFTLGVLLTGTVHKIEAHTVYGNIAGWWRKYKIPELEN